MAESVLQSKKALKKYAIEDNAKLDKVMLETIHDPDLWNDLEDFAEVLRPITDAIHESSRCSYGGWSRGSGLRECRTIA